MLISIFSKKGFTLSEVLITLAIVGIVAVMTIPSLVGSSQKTELEARFAKSYRTLMHAVNMAVAEHGGIESWEWKDNYSSKEMDDFVQKYLVPYLNVAKFCSSGGSDARACDSGNHTLLNGNAWGPLGRGMPMVILSDGMLIDFYFKTISNNIKCLAVRVDINGHKKPNVAGIDTFSFELYQKTGEFLPRGIYNDAFERNTIEKIYQYCSKGGNGHSCAARIIQDGFKMNYDW